LMPRRLANQRVKRKRMWLFMRRRAVEVGGSRDMGKVKWFACHKTGHYASQCPKKKKKKKKKESDVAATTSTEMDAFAEKFEDEFSLVASLSSSSRLAELEDSGAWFVDSGSSHHMTGMRSVLLNFTYDFRQTPSKF
jgi:hypothetical protein